MLYFAAILKSFYNFYAVQTKFYVHLIGQDLVFRIYDKSLLQFINDMVVLLNFL